jgi:ParB family chromosome partitioning protein
VEEGDIDPVELSLVENVMRDDMHPADKFEAFRDLVDKGHSTADIAARFGATEKHVTQLLRLARVSPAVLKAYREGRLTLEQVMAFAVTDDHDAQKRLFQSFGRFGREPRDIRDALTENEITTDDRRVKFVGDAYKKAGGAIRPDWFGKEENSGFILDPALLGRLVTEMLDRIIKDMAGEGWKWTAAYAEFGYEQRSQFRLIHPAPAESSNKLASEVAKLEAEFETLESAWDEAGEDVPYPERCEQIRKRLNEIERSRERVWTPEKLAIAGAVVTIGNDGKPEIIRGLVRPEDMPKESKKAKGKAAQSGPGEDGAGESPSQGLSAALVESLTAHRSAALAAEITERPDFALAAVVHAMASCVFFEGCAEDGTLQLDAFPQSLHRVEGSKALERMEAARKTWRDQIPADADGLWTWCLGRTQETLLQLLAFCAAATVNAVQGKGDRPEGKRLTHAKALASSLGLDMKTWFMPDAANYFSRVSKPQIFDALKEGRNQPPAPAWEKLKKAELAALAERELAGKGWLPEILRPAA